MVTNNKTVVNSSSILNILFLILVISTLIQGHKNIVALDNIINIVLISGSILYILINKKNIYCDRYLIIFIFFMVTSTCIIGLLNPNYFSFEGALKGVISFIEFIFIVFILSGNKCNKKLFWSIINKISKITIFIVIFQSLLYYGLGIKLHDIPFIGEWIFKAFEMNQKYRPCAFFSEPSHLSEFVLLSCYYYIFIENNFKTIIFYCIGIFFSTSGIGIIGIAILMSIYLIIGEKFNNKDYSNKRKFFILLSKITIILAVCLLIGDIYTGMLTSENWLLNRLASGGTFDVRVLRSFDIFGNLNIREQIFGIGLQNQANYLNYYNIVSKYDIADTLSGREYAQTWGYILVTLGVTGLVAFLIPWIRILHRGSKESKVLVILFVYICMMSNMMTRNIIIVYMVMIFVQNNKSKPYIRKL